MKIPIYKCCWLVIVCAFSSVAVGQSFEELEVRLQNHHSLEQIRFQIEALRDRAEAATALPDPEISLDLNNVPLRSPSFDRFLPSNKSVGLRQSIPNSASRKARQAHLGEEAKQLQAVSAMRYSELYASLISDLVNKDRINRQRTLLKRQQERYDELIQVASSEVDAGRPAVFRLAQIEARKAQIAYQLVELEGELAKIDASLVELVGLVPQTKVPTQISATWNEDPNQFHYVRVASFDATKADQDIVAAKADYKPNWHVHLSYQQRESGRGAPDSSFAGDDWFTAGVAFSVPVWGKKKQALNVRAAESYKRSAQSHVVHETYRTIALYERYNAERETALASLQALHDNIAAMKEVIVAQLSQYESGVGDYAPIIEGEIAILELKALLAIENSREQLATVNANALLVTP